MNELEKENKELKSKVWVLRECLQAFAQHLSTMYLIKKEKDILQAYQTTQRVLKVTEE